MIVGYCRCMEIPQDPNISWCPINPSSKIQKYRALLEVVPPSAYCVFLSVLSSVIEETCLTESTDST